MRILIIEDQIKTATYLKKGLCENGFSVDLAQDGEEGMFYVTSANYDLVIVDILLPKLDGWSVITKIRQLSSSLLIMALTACDAVPDRVKGFELGADDYLIKPFSFAECLARIRSLLRRGQIHYSDVIQIADLTINISQHKVKRATVTIQLTAKEFKLLTLLARRAGEVLSRTLIAELVWDMNFDSDTNVVDVAIRRLRQKIDDPFEHKLIRTVHGVGYVLQEFVEHQQM